MIKEAGLSYRCLDIVDWFGLTTLQLRKIKTEDQSTCFSELDYESAKVVETVVNLRKSKHKLEELAILLSPQPDKIS
jgi:hypothetical protein